MSKGPQTRRGEAPHGIVDARRVGASSLLVRFADERSREAFLGRLRPPAEEPPSESVHADVALPLNPVFTFDTFVPTAGTRMAHIAALSAAEGAGPARNPVYLWGESGTGKTHLLQAACARAQARRGKALYTCAEHFANVYIEAARGGTASGPLAAVKDSSLVAIDDIQFLKKTARTARSLTRTLLAARKEGVLILLSGNRAPERLTKTSPLLGQLLHEGLTCRMLPPTGEEMRNLVRSRALLLDVSVGEEQVEAIASSVSSPHEVDGALMAALIAPSSAIVPTPAAVVEWLRSRLPGTGESAARQAVAWTLKEKMGLSGPGVMRFFGREWRGRVSYAVKRGGKFIESLPNGEDVISELVKLLDAALKET